MCYLSAYRDIIRASLSDQSNCRINMRNQFKSSVLTSGILILVVVSVLPAMTGRAAEPQETSRAVVGVSPADAIPNLKRLHANGESTVVFENELNELIDPSGGGPCASAAGINALQTLLLMIQRTPLSNPHKAVLSAVQDQPVLLKGRVSNKQFERLMRFYAPYLGRSPLKVDITSAANSSHTEGGRLWPAEGPDFRVAAGTLKVLSYTVTKADGNIAGRHFVLLENHKNNQIDVLDPNNPLGKRSYVLQHMLSDNSAFNRIYLLQPAGAPARTETYELNTVFKLELPGADSRDGASVVTLESIKSSIDKTAEELLTGRTGVPEDFVSPVLWRQKTAKYGLPALDLPTNLGGSAWSAEKMLEVFRHAGKHNLNFRDVVGGAHGRLLLNSEKPAALDIVRKVGCGEAYIAVALTEPDVGSDFRSMKSSARRVDGGYLLSGEKRYVARLQQASHVVLFTRAANGKERDLSAFILPMDTKGLEHVPLEAHGLLGNSFGGLKFKDVFVSDDQLLGEDGKGTRYFVDHFRYWRLMQAATALGTAERALEMMKDRLVTRQAYGGPIGRFTHLQQALGQSTTELRMAMSLARDAASHIDAHEYDQADPLISGLKAEGVEMALRAVDSAVRAFGAEGYSNRVDLGDRLRDLNGLRIADGTTDVMRMDVVRQVYGRELWDMAIRSLNE